MITWRKSSHSGGGGEDGQECVEVARLPEGVGVRDSKAPEAGHLFLSRAAFTHLLTHAKRADRTP
jgi:uncharacterized protein DUF397